MQDSFIVKKNKIPGDGNQGKYLATEKHNRYMMQEGSFCHAGHDFLPSFCEADL